MSFTCKACGNQRAGAASPVVCSDCDKTQLGQAVKIAATFKGLYEEQIDALDGVLGEVQKAPSDPDHKWWKLRQLVDAARRYNDALASAMEP